ncbi:MAG TPA: septal ring lytic transglycosylase RlpA family lipoprotein [Spirochaetaceae bacterium]|nr:septal ring lytic transglycosylase RlpA family lipoprotein [Spirochaetaceae bacterium]
MRRSYALLALVALVAMAAAQSATAQGASAGSSQGDSIESGLASWYGQPFHGRLTASGEVYDMEAMTAAHKTLPFGTVVRVLCLDTGANVVVRINDRGPFVAGRIIDLSAAAARVLGLDRRGLSRVSLSIVSSAAAKPPSSASGTLRVQVASFSAEPKARELAASLAGRGFQAAVEQSGAGLYRVIVPAKDRNAAGLQLERIKALGYTDAFIKSGD